MRLCASFHGALSLWPYPQAPLDDRDDIVVLDYADTSGLDDVDVLEFQRLNGGTAQTRREIGRIVSSHFMFESLWRTACTLLPLVLPVHVELQGDIGIDVQYCHMMYSHLC